MVVESPAKALKREEDDDEGLSAFHRAEPGCARPGSGQVKYPDADWCSRGPMQSRELRWVAWGARYK